MWDPIIDWLYSVVIGLRDAVNWLLIRVAWLAEYLFTLLRILAAALETFIGWVLAGARLIKDGFLRAIRALLHLKPSDIWKAIKKGYERFNKFLDWWESKVAEPLNRIRRDIWGIYNRLFKPILLVMDSFRRIVRIVAIFDRRLAAKLDSKFYALESKLMWPITQVLRRVNELSSYTRAIITARGLLSRALVLESIRRDALMVWEVLTNPRGRIFAPPERGAPLGLREMSADFEQYVLHGTGPLAATMDDLDRFAEETALEVM